MYQRVIPRDLFNESALLKCLGRLSLLVNDDMGGSLKIRYNGKPFDIRRNDGSGGLYCGNFRAYNKGKPISLETSLNSRDHYPLWYYIEGMKEYERVFAERVS
jgi:hypothetical protein